jgi:hypothetical protein
MKECHEYLNLVNESMNSGHKEQRA